MERLHYIDGMRIQPKPELPIGKIIQMHRTIYMAYPDFVIMLMVLESKKYMNEPFKAVFSSIGFTKQSLEVCCAYVRHVAVRDAEREVNRALQTLRAKYGPVEPEEPVAQKRTVERFSFSILDY